MWIVYYASDPNLKTCINAWKNGMNPLLDLMEIINPVTNENMHIVSDYFCH
jgi:hypothetical protein